MTYEELCARAKAYIDVNPDENPSLSKLAKMMADHAKYFSEGYISVEWVVMLAEYIDQERRAK